MEWLELILAGLGVGLLIGLTGVGGGSVMTPLLILGWGVPPLTAVGTDLLFAAGTKAGGLWPLWRLRRIPWAVVGWMALGSVPVSALTVWWMSHQLHNALSSVESLVKLSLGVALLLTAGVTLYKAMQGTTFTPAQALAPTGAESGTDRHPSLTVALGAVIGALVSLTSVGAGALGMTALLLLYPRLPLPRTVAADIAHAVPLTLVAGLGHSLLGHVDWALLSALLLGSIPGIWLGTQWVHRLPTRLSRLALSLVLALAGSKLVGM